ncbi:MAG TPA: DUF2066 domain-containing protein [Steroidobacteraceae bacterium]|nr:DUF2066 domain-containing protein [Steroidobacteraceae bacterium]
MRSTIVSFIAVAVLLAANPASATRQVRVYETNVSAHTDPAVQAQAGLRVVLVRATGERNAANDPALAGLLAKAQQYVIGTQPARGGALTLFFDAAALERDITAAGRTIWASERPVLLVVLTGGPAGGATESRRQVEGTLDAAGNRRGQPINIVRPEAVGLPTAGDISQDIALAAAQRARADGALIGYGDAVANGGTWRWVLYASGVTETWNGTLEEGVHGAADVFARNAAVFAATPDLAVLVEIEGVPTLREYAGAAQILADAPGVRSVQLAEAAGNRSTFTVVTRGGSDALLSALSANGRFERIDPKAGGNIAFRLRP